MLELLEKTDLSGSDFDDTLDHFYCLTCYPDGSGTVKGLCSSILSGVDEGTVDHVSCVVCDWITKCPDCGEEFA